jgi:hypothetical protein
MNPNLNKKKTIKLLNEKVNYQSGKSTDCISSILQKKRQSVIFWLDDHWSGGKTSGEEKDCTLLEEIQVINNWEGESIILINNASLFLSTPHKPHQPEHWPTISELINKLNSSSIEKFIVIIHDVIIAIPFHLKPIVEQFCVNENTLAWGKRNANISMNHKQESHLKKSLYHLKRFLAKSIHR